MRLKKSMLLQLQLVILCGVAWMRLYLRLRVLLLQHMLPGGRLSCAYLLPNLHRKRRRLGGIDHLGRSSFWLRTLWCNLDEVNRGGRWTVWCWREL